MKIAGDRNIVCNHPHVFLKLDRFDHLSRRAAAVDQERILFINQGGRFVANRLFDGDIGLAFLTIRGLGAEMIGIHRSAMCPLYNPLLFQDIQISPDGDDRHSELVAKFLYTDNPLPFHQI